MKESNIILLSTSIFIILGIIVMFFPNFTFQTSKITLEDETITETLTFQTNKPYHTLYRYFEDKISTNANTPNSINPITASCQSGTPYFRTDYQCLDENLKSFSCPAYTEKNEFGCTFGNTYGFKENTNYEISAQYTLSPTTIYKIENQYYTKFIAYSDKDHPFLGENFKTSNNILRKNFYLSEEEVIVYVPTTKTENKKIIELKKPQFSSTIILLLSYLLYFIPAGLIFFTWHFFGRDSDTEIPEILSMIPDEKNKRKPWEISAFFSPPLKKFDKNLFASTMMDFLHRKIITAKLEEGKWRKKLLIKINKDIPKLDEVEVKILTLLKILEKKSGEFFEMKAGLFDRATLQSTGKSIEEEIKEKSKKYLSKDISKYIIFAMFAGFLLANAISPSLVGKKFILLILAAGFMIIASKTSAIFTKHKEQYYKEYLHWQSFKKYLKNAFSIKNATHKTIIMWEEYLIYATALGVPKKVLKELKSQNIINATQEKLYLGMYAHSSSFMASSGASSSGGGGGVGGGGGGGR